MSKNKKKEVQKHNWRLTDKQFFAMLRENAGLFARTARAIEAEFGISYSRQAVRDRAIRSPEILYDIEEENIDIAEEGLHTLMRSKSERIRLRAIELFLKTKGKSRGYVERHYHDHNLKDNGRKGDSIDWEVVEVIEDDDQFEDAEIEENGDNKGQT